MDYSWINTTWTSLLMVLLSTIGMYVSLIIYTRIAGLRSFSTISTFDFGITVAIGAIFASAILTQKPPLIQAIVALGALYVLQMGIARLRGRWPLIHKIVDNDPILLMEGSEIKDENLKKARVTYEGLRGKLREANVTKLNQVKAVVMESTGDISVLHHGDTDHKLDDELLRGVRGFDT